MRTGTNSLRHWVVGHLYQHGDRPEQLRRLRQCLFIGSKLRIGRVHWDRGWLLIERAVHQPRHAGLLKRSLRAMRGGV